MLNNILEISEKTNKNGRVSVKIALHKIHEVKEETNKNGIHWDENHTKNAMHTVKGMPLCCEFIDDDKSTPYGHGLTGEVIREDGIREPIFENSEVVGSFYKSEIETIKDRNGNDIKALCGYANIYYQRYPNLVDWIRKNKSTGEIDTSIEIMGLVENNNQILYDGKVSEEYRIPEIYSYSGCAVLSISPSDNDAVILEISQKKTNKEEQKDMELNMNEIKDAIQSTISELNDKSSAYETKIAELNSQIESKDAELTEKDTTISELNASVKEMKDLLTQMESDRDSYWREREILEQEIAKAKIKEKLDELDDSLAEFNSDEKEVAKDDIEKLKDNINACKKREELNSVTSEINSIKSKICMNIVENQKKAAKEAVIAEQNSKKETFEIEDIFSEVCSEKGAEPEEEINIF